MSFPMENNEHLSYPGFTREDSPRSVPSLIHLTAASSIPFFDVIKDQNDFDSSSHHSLPPAAAPKTNSIKSQSDLSQPQGVHSVSISMPSSPMKLLLQSNKKVLFRDDGEKNPNNDGSNSSATSKNPMVKPPTFHSQSIPTDSAFEKTLGSRKFPYLSEFLPRNPSMNKFKDKRYNSFKTWSVKHWETGSDRDVSKYSEAEGLHVDRYFDALEGPELETLKASEEILLPEDKLWPFLLRYPVSSFGICLGISSQAIMWKNLAISPSMEFLHVSPIVNLILWCISLALVSTVSFIYLLKVIFYFEAVRREYYHPIRVNFFFAPWIALLFLAIGSPPFVMENLHQSLWYVLMAPIFCLELKIYGQWMSGGQRRLSKVANPSNHLSVVGNFVGALLGATMGLKEGPIFFFAIGLAHYTVLFVTLYQRLPTNETLPKDLHPVFFLFVAAPSVASMAWARIQGSFDCGSRVAYFVGLFLYFSLAVRVNFFRGFRFSIAWWAYTFPMTGASIATIKYSNEVKNMLTKSLALVLCSISTLTVLSLLITTIIHAFVLRDLFPNDISIAISENKNHNSESDCSDSVDLEKLP